MTISFMAKNVNVIKTAEYDLISFSDSKVDPTEYVMIQMAHKFDSQDIALGMNGEYFEYGYEDDIGAEYKCVQKVKLTSTSIFFYLSPPIKGNITEIKIKLEDKLLNESALELLTAIFAGKLLLK